MSLNVPARHASISIATLVLFAVSVAGPWPASGQARGEHRLSMGEVAVIDPWTLRFVAVASDNRCPAGAQCIVAGRAVVILELTSAEEPEGHHERSLEIPPAGGDLLLGDLHLRLVVEPEARLDRPIEPSEYELVIKVVPGL